MKVAIIDADSLVWAIAWNNKDSLNPEVLVKSVDDAIIDILVNTQASHYVGLLQGEQKSPRHVMFPSYKSNRPVKPEWFTRAKEIIYSHLTSETTWKFLQVQGCEVDDAVASIAKTIQGIDTYVVVSVDKDLDQVSGVHYNPKTKEGYEISHSEALRNLCLQLLTGDSTDNVKGVPGIGPVKAEQALFRSTKIPVYNGLEATYHMPDFCKVLVEYCYYYKDPVKGMIAFSENVLQLAMRKDIHIKFMPIPVPSYIQRLFSYKGDSTEA